MSAKDKLDIVLITYNRAKNLKNALSQILNEESPVKDYSFTVIDNNSTDETYEVIKEFQKKYENLKYKKNKYNIGLSANIVFGMYEASKDYVWIISDDDKYDFSNWKEVEDAIERGEDIICCARYALPDEHKNDLAYQLLQVTFISGLIMNTKIFNDKTMRCTFDNIYTIFPHMSPIAMAINEGKKIYVTDKPITDNGMIINETNASYIRGLETSGLYMRTRSNSWIVGYTNVLSVLDDKKLISKAQEVAIVHPHIYTNFRNFYHNFAYYYTNSQYWSQFYDVWQFLYIKHKIYLLLNLLYFIIKKQNLFLKIALKIRRKHYKKKLGIEFYPNNEKAYRVAFLKTTNQQNHLYDFGQKYKNKRVMLYGAGIYANVLLENFDFSQINIVGISDKKFKNISSFKNIKAYPPELINDTICDVILYTSYDNTEARKYFMTHNILIPQVDLIKKTNELDIFNKFINDSKKLYN